MSNRKRRNLTSYPRSDPRRRDHVLPHEARADTIYIIYDPLDDTFYCAHAQAWVTRVRVFDTLPHHRWRRDEITGPAAYDLTAVATRYTQADIASIRSVNMFPSNGILISIGDHYDLGPP